MIEFIRGTFLHIVTLQTLLKIWLSVMFWPFDPAKNAIKGDAPEGSDTF